MNKSQPKTKSSPRIITGQFAHDYHESKMPSRQYPSAAIAQGWSTRSTTRIAGISDGAPSDSEPKSFWVREAGKGYTFLGSVTWLIARYDIYWFISPIGSWFSFRVGNRPNDTFMEKPYGNCPVMATAIELAKALQLLPTTELEVAQNRIAELEKENKRLQGSGIAQHHPMVLCSL